MQLQFTQKANGASVLVERIKEYLTILASGKKEQREEGRLEENMGTVVVHNESPVSTNTTNTFSFENSANGTYSNGSSERQNTEDSNFQLDCETGLIGNSWSLKPVVVVKEPAHEQVQPLTIKTTIDNSSQTHENWEDTFQKILASFNTSITEKLEELKRELRGNFSDSLSELATQVAQQSEQIRYIEDAVRKKESVNHVDKKEKGPLDPPTSPPIAIASKSLSNLNQLRTSADNIKIPGKKVTSGVRKVTLVKKTSSTATQRL